MRIGAICACVLLLAGADATAADTPAPIVIEVEATLGESVAGLGPSVQMALNGRVNVSGAITLSFSLPLGAHMVAYRGEHVEGPWHGGGWIPDPGSPSVEVPLSDVLIGHATMTGRTTGVIEGAWKVGPHTGGVFAGVIATGSARCEVDLDPGRRLVRCTLTGSAHSVREADRT